MRKTLKVLLGSMALAWGSTQAAQGAEVSFMVFGDPAEKAAFESLVAAFDAKFPDINVTLTHIPGQNDYRRRIATDFASNSAADITLINYRRYASFAVKGVLEPVGPYLAKSQVIKEADFYPEAIQPFYWNGELMCIPQNLSSLVVYYNKKLFDEAGLAYPSDDWTWDDFLTTAKTLTKETDGDGAMDQHGLGTEASIFRLAPFIWQNGGEVVVNPDDPSRLALDTPEAAEATKWFIALQTEHKVVPNAVEEASEDSETRFQNGRLAMFLNSRRGVPTYREIEAFDWDVAPLPQGKQKAGILHADAYCMSKSATEKDAVWTFIEYANSVEGQTIVAASGRTVPSLKSVAESPAFLDPNVKPSRSNVFLDSIPFIRGVPVMETWVDIESTVGNELERGFYGQASADEIIAESIRRTDEYFSH